MSSFVYDCLPDAPAARSEDNLRQLIALLAARAPKAIKAGLVARCLAGEALEPTEPLDDRENDRAVSWELTRLEFEAAPPPPAEPEPELIAAPDEPLDRTIALMAAYRRPALLVSSILLAFAARVVLLESYSKMPFRLLWPIQLAIWVPVLLVLTVAYVAVQLRLEALKNRRDGTPGT